ncbi:HAD family hydrolase [Halomonas korlensis]|uniref:Putative hydrolase of the HAD superfamily n=1 Tax=Halomonas korlensis TaxID=463301 RepID=A0A1I7K677_9GAMM|nr:HAD family hydrolase [Halomonas korlensis]SFU92904.1 putative hydrolase of the HAD superfamily [Halomonas korlensis]
MTATTLKAITFDLDDTLWDNHGVMERTEAGHYAWLDAALAEWLEHSSGIPPERFAERFPLAAYQERRLALARRHPERRSDFTWLREHALASLLRDYALPEHDAAHWAGLGMQRFLELRHDVTPHPEVEAMLEALALRYRLASITNGNVDIARLGWQHHFPIAIAAGELCTPKPDPRPFLAALSRLQTQPAETLHVGDSWQEDALPAWRLGMPVAWIASADTGLPAGIHRLSHIRELPELLAWLDRR